VAADEQAKLDAELAAAVRGGPLVVHAPAWADGPSAIGARGDDAGADGHDGGAAETTLDERLAAARDSAASARTASTRSHAALYRALGRAHDFALAADGDAARLGTLLAEAGIKAQARAPMTAIAKLVFGRDHDKTRLTEVATILAYARRIGVGPGALARVLEMAPGGIKGVVADERAARRPAAADRATPLPLAMRGVLGEVAIDCGVDAGTPVVLLGRATASGIEVVGTIANDAKLAERMLLRIA
jgi:hypothetical protein